MELFGVNIVRYWKSVTLSFLLVKLQSDAIKDYILENHLSMRSLKYLQSTFRYLVHLFWVK
jgi:hypothetical protein